LKYSADYILFVTGIPLRTQYNVARRVKERGFDYTADPRIFASYVEDAPRKGGPKAITKDIEKELLVNVRASRADREKSSEVLAYKCGISYSSALRILHKNGLSNVKPITKPGLTDLMKNARYVFAKAHEHWTLEDWKQVIWTDEISVILGSRRGTVRLWRDLNERFNPTVVRSRWKGFSEFMFWGSFSYDRKGLCYIYKPETKKMKELADEEIRKLNNEI
jgi:transposase